jgi:DNA-binding NarL/FixJ family response regulator
MQSLFLSPPHIQSPRWRQAFPSAQIISVPSELPHNMRGLLIWVSLNDVILFSSIPQWVALGAKVIVLTQAENPAQAKQVLEAGASGYLHYLAAVPVLEQVSQVVALGGLWLGADLMRQLVLATASIIKPISASHHLDLLSAREQDVAKAVAAGKSNKEVAKQLDITERTVKAHLSAVFEKLQARDRLHLVLILSRSH